MSDERRSEWTPGPWWATYSPNSFSGSLYTVDAPSGRVTNVPTDNKHFPNSEADARLIAAAPDMADLLERVAQAQESPDLSGDDFELAGINHGVEARRLLSRIIQPTSPDTSVDREETE